MATDLTKVVGSIPYVTPTGSVGEFTSDFIPLGAKDGQILLNLGDGFYYDVVVVDGATHLERGESQESTATVVTARAEQEHFAARYTAIADFGYDTTGDLPTTDNPFTDNRGYDSSGDPLYAQGFDYVSYGQDLADVALPLAKTWYDEQAALVSAAVAPDATDEDILAGAQAIAWGILSTEDALVEYTERQTAFEKVMLQKWVAAGELFKEILANDEFDGLDDLFTDRVSLDASGFTYASVGGEDAAAVSGRQPARGPFDYLVDREQTDINGDTVSDATFPELAAAVAAASTTAEKVAVFRVFLPASRQDVPQFLTTLKKVLVYDPTPWPQGYGITLDDTSVAWDGKKWVSTTVTLGGTWGTGGTGG